MEESQPKKSYFAKLRSEETEMLDSGTEIAIWYAIKSFAGGEAHICFASEREIAKRARVSQDSVGRVRKKLEQKGLIKNLGKKKTPNSHWKTYWLKIQLNADRSDLSDSRSEVNDGAEQVNDSRNKKHKGNRNKNYPLEEKILPQKSRARFWDYARELKK